MMKTKKNTLKCLIAVFVMVMTFCFASITAQAATKTKKITLYVGEKVQYTYIGLGTMKSVKSSKSSVVSASKKKKGSTSYSEMTAKKKGSAKVTVKGTRGTFIYVIKVKAAPKIEVSFEPRADKYINVYVNNKSDAYFSSVKVDVSFKDAAGNEVATDRVYINYLGAKKSACQDIYPPYYKGIDFSKTTYVVTYDREFDKSCSDYTSKVKYTDSMSNGRFYLKTSINYKKSAYVYAGYTIYFYDAAGNMVGVRDGYTYMSGSNKKYRSYSYDFSVPDNSAVSYKLVKRAMMVK